MSQSAAAKPSLVIIDTNVFLHSINTQYEKNPHLNDDDREKTLYFNTMYLLSGAYLEKILSPDEQIEVVFAMDLQPYWRTAKLLEIGCDYKGKRNAAQMSHRKVVVDSLKNKLYDYLCNIYNLPLFTIYAERESDKFPLVGFEADDIAAGLVLTQRYNYRKIYTVTNDNDWLPFTTFDNVRWINLQNGQHRFKDSAIAMTWLKTCSEVMKSKERQNFVFNDVKDLWNFKAYFGDISDNIAGDKKDKSPGKYLEYISLFQPTKGFECWKLTDFESKFKNSKTKPHPIMSMSAIRALNPGFPLVTDVVYPTENDRQAAVSFFC